MAELLFRCRARRPDPVQPRPAPAPGGRPVATLSPASAGLRHAEL